MDRSGASKPTADAKKGKKGKNKTKASSIGSKKLSPPKIFKTFASKGKDPVKAHNDEEELDKALESYMRKELNKTAPDLTSGIDPVIDSVLPGAAFVASLGDKKTKGGKPKTKGRK